MSEEKKTGVFEIVCPCCQSVLWVDAVNRQVVKTEKHAAKKKGTLDELLEKEKREKRGSMGSSRPPRSSRGRKRKKPGRPSRRRWANPARTTDRSGSRPGSL